MSQAHTRLTCVTQTVTVRQSTATVYTYVPKRTVTPRPTGLCCCLPVVSRYRLAHLTACLLPTLSVCPSVWSLILQDARHAAEAEIYTNLNAKIDQFLQLADYNWQAPAQGGATPLTTSDYLIDLIAFLNSTFAVFTNLPVSTSTHTHTPRNRATCNTNNCYNLFKKAKKSLLA